MRQANPEIVLVEAERIPQLLSLISNLRQDLPGTWIFAVGEATDAQTVISAVRAGAREFLAQPVTDDAVRQAIERYFAENPRKQGRVGTVFAVMSAKGGSGATSVAINLASSAGELPGTRVALADLSRPLGDVAAYLSLKPKYTLNDALKAASRLDPVLLETFMTIKSGIHILAGQVRIEPSPEAPVESVSKLIRVLSETFSHSVLDLSGVMSEELLQAVLERVDQVLVVLTAEIPAVWRALHLIQFLEQGGLDSKLKILLNRAQTGGDIGPKEIEKALKRRIFWQVPNNYRSTMAALNAGRAAVEGNHSNLAQSYSVLAESLTGIKKAKKRLLGLFS
jgi:pilus assembly protein CpaE